MGLDLADSYPAQAEAQLRADDPSHRWVRGTGIPVANVFSAVRGLRGSRSGTQPQVAVFTLGEIDDVLPDLMVQLRQGGSDSVRGLSRFALYRMGCKVAAWARYAAARGQRRRA
jgi:hypothetical protein